MRASTLDPCQYCGGRVTCAVCLYCNCYRYEHTPDTCETRAVRNDQVAEILHDMGLPLSSRVFECE